MRVQPLLAGTSTRGRSGSGHGALEQAHRLRNEHRRHRRIEALEVLARQVRVERRYRIVDESDIGETASAPKEPAQNPHSRPRRRNSVLVKCVVCDPRIRSQDYGASEPKDIRQVPIKSSREGIFPLGALGCHPHPSPHKSRTGTNREGLRLGTAGRGGMSCPPEAPTAHLSGARRSLDASLEATPRFLDLDPLRRPPVPAPVVLVLDFDQPLLLEIRERALLAGQP